MAKGLIFFSRGDLVHRLRGEPEASIGTTLCGRKAFVGKCGIEVSRRRHGHGYGWVVGISNLNPVSCLQCQRSQEAMKEQARPPVLVKPEAAEGIEEVDGRIQPLDGATE